MTPHDIELLIAVPVGLALLLLARVSMKESLARLADPDDDRTLHVGELETKTCLHPLGVYEVIIYRQSGNVHARHVVEGSARLAVEAAVTTMRRAKIDAVNVGENGPDRMRFHRLYHDHRGRAEGKKVGGADIRVLKRQELDAAAPAVRAVVRTLGMKCDDCGERIEVDVAGLSGPRTCPSCGSDATLTQDQIASIDRAIEDVREQAMRRYETGERDVVVEHKFRS